MFTRGQQTWITITLNGLPWKQTEIILSFLRLHPSTAFQTLFVDRDGHSISSKGFLPAVVDIRVVWVKFTHSSPFLVRWFPRMLAFTLSISFWPLPICLDPWTWRSRFLCNIALYSIGPCFYHQSHHNWVLFLRWPHPFILSGVISPLISRSLLGIYWPGEFLFTFCHKGDVICIYEIIGISPGNLDSSLCFFQPRVSHEVVCIEVK